MKVLGKEVEFSYTDIDNINKLNKVLPELAEKIQNNNGNSIENLTVQFNAIKDGIDELLGKGTYDKLTDGKKDIMEAIRAFRDIIVDKNRQEKEALKEADSMFKQLKNEMKEAEQYTPDNI